MSHTLQAFVWSELCFAKRSIVKILLRKTAYSKLCFAKWSSTATFIFAVHKRQRSSLFLTAPFSSGCILCGSLVRTLLRKAAYGSRIMVKAFCYAKRSATAPFSSGCILCGSLFRTLLRKVATPPHLSLRFIKGLT